MGRLREHIDLVVEGDQADPVLRAEEVERGPDAGEVSLMPDASVMKLRCGPPHCVQGTPPAAGFAAPVDPDHVRQMALGVDTGPFVTPVIEGLPPAYEELRRAWSDAWDRANGVAPRARATAEA